MSEGSELLYSTALHYTVSLHCDKQNNRNGEAEVLYRNASVAAGVLVSCLPLTLHPTTMLGKSWSIIHTHLVLFLQNLEELTKLGMQNCCAKISERAPNF